MNNFQILLNKYIKIKGSQNTLIDQVQQILKNDFNISINKDVISVYDKTIHLNISPLQRHEIHIQKDKIISLLKKEGFLVEDIN